MKIELIEVKGEHRLVEVTAEPYELFTHASKPCVYPFQMMGNQHEYDRVLRTPSAGFSGGTFDELFISPDMAPFKKAKEKLERSELTRRISQKLTNINRRRRKLSSHDGEWSIDRKWEIEPFFSAKSSKTDNRILEIEVHMNVSAVVESNQIAEFGHMVWALNDIIESCGINTQIVMFSRSIGTAGWNSNLDVQAKVILKKPGEYVNPVNIAKCLTPNFFRRIIFDWFIIGCDFANEISDPGLGRPYSHPHTVKFEDGKLIITSEAIRESNSIRIQNEVVKAILGAK